VVGGRAADTRVGNKGLPWWSVFLALAGGAVCMWFGVNWAGRKVVGEVMGVGKETAVQKSSVKSFLPGKGAEKVVPVDSKPLDEVVRVEMVGYWLIGREVEVWLSDGRVLGRSQLRAVTEDRAVGISGEIYPLRRAVRSRGSEPVGRSHASTEGAAVRPAGRP